MKSKQLANVLIKIVGLYVCLLAIPELVSGIVGALLRIAGSSKFDQGLWMVTNGIAAAVQAAVGIYIITRSRKIAEFWFKNEDD